jgi:hypothetical protein
MRAPFELLDCLAALIPPPRRHRHHYAGVFAPHASSAVAVAADIITHRSSYH